MSWLVAALGAAVVALAIGAAVASGAVSFVAATPVPPTAVAVVATPTVDLGAAAVQLQTDESGYCQCGK